MVIGLYNVPKKVGTPNFDIRFIAENPLPRFGLLPLVVSFELWGHWNNERSSRVSTAISNEGSILPVQTSIPQPFGHELRSEISQFLPRLPNFTTVEH